MKFNNAQEVLYIEIKERILKLLKEYPNGLPIAEISKRLSIHRNTVSKYVFALKEAGLLEYKKVGSFKVFFLKENGKKLKKTFLLFSFTLFLFFPLTFALPLQWHPASEVILNETANINLTYWAYPEDFSYIYGVRIYPGTVGSLQIADYAITTSKIADHAITGIKLSYPFVLEGSVNANNYNIYAINWLNASYLNVSTVAYIEKLGIGTTSPVKKLDVAGDINATGAVYSINGYYVGTYQIIDSARTANFASLKIGGTTVIDSNRNVIAGNWINGTNAYFSGTIYGNVQGSITPTGDINMQGYSIYNANWVNASNFNASNTVYATTIRANEIYQAGNRVVSSITAGNGLIGGEVGPSVNLDVNVNTAKGLQIVNDALETKIGTGLGYDANGNIYVLYGSSPGTAAEGSKQITISAGTGLSGGGTITIGAGGTVNLAIDTNVVPRKDTAETITQPWTFAENVWFNKNVFIAGNLSYVNVATLNVNGSLIPVFSGQFDVGNSSNKWANVYAVNVYGDNVYSGGNLVLTTNTDFSGNVTGKYNALNLAPNSVDSAKIVDNSITPSDVAFNFVGSIQAGSGISVTGGTGKGVTNTISINYNTDLLGWENLTNYPSSCPAGFAVQAIGDTLTCIQINATQGVINGSGAAGQVAFFTASNTISGSNNLYWDNTNARLGIGTTSPAYKLDVAGDIRATGIIYGTIVGNYGGGLTAGSTGITAYYYVGSLPYSSASVYQKLYIQVWGGGSGAWHWYGSGIDEYVISTRDALKVYRSRKLGETLNYQLLIYNNTETSQYDVYVAVISQNHPNILIRSFKLDSPDYWVEQPVIQKTPSGTDVTSSFEFINTIITDRYGNVGIGTTSPSQKLTVAGNIGIQAGANAFIGTLDNYALSLRTNNADRIFITNDGNVGIGTTTPTKKLHVEGDVNITGDYLYLGNSFRFRDGNNNWLYLGTPTGDYSGTGWAMDRLWVNSASYLLGNIYARGSISNDQGVVTINDDVNIDSGTFFLNATTNNVGIGTTSPSQKLTVAGNIGIQAGANAFIGTLDNYALSLRTNNADRIFITNDGNVGIGTTNPGAKLDVEGGIEFNNLETNVMNRIVPIYIRGTGLNNNANRVLKIGSTTIYDTTGRGLRFTVINKADYSILYDATFDTYGYASESNNLASNITNRMNKNTIGILTSWDAWEGQITDSLRDAFRRCGLIKAFMTPTSPVRQPYAAIFECNTTTTSAKAVEVLTTHDANERFAEIRGWLIDGSFVATGDAPNSLTDNLGRSVVFVSSAGNVGIGTTSPANKLDVAGTGRLRADGGLGDVLKIGGASIPMGLTTEVGGTTPLLNLDINFRHSDKNLSYVGGAFRIDARSPSYPLFQFLARPAGGTETVLMAITEAGNVGIGTTSPSQKLTVAGNIGIQAGANAFIGTLDNYALSLRTNNADRIFITNDGNVGIGTTNPLNKLEVSGTFNATFGGGIIYLDNNGNIKVGI